MSSMLASKSLNAYNLEVCGHVTGYYMFKTSGTLRNCSNRSYKLFCKVNKVGQLNVHYRQLLIKNASDAELCRFGPAI